MYILIIVGLGLLGGCLGAWRAWQQGTEALSHSIDVASAPKGMRGRDYRRGIRHHRKRRRLLITILSALAGATLGVGTAFGLALLQGVR